MPKPAGGRETKLRPGGGSIAPGAADAALAPVIDALHEHVARTGLDQGERQQVGARLPASLIQQAKRRTGLRSNTDLLTVALVNLVAEDSFADVFERVHGQLDPDLDLGF